MRIRLCHFMGLGIALMLGLALSCNGGGGGNGSPPPPPQPVISSFTAAPGTITTGGTSTLAWSVSLATSLDIDHGVGTVSGTSKVVSPAATTTYTLTATNGGNVAAATATVTVVPPPAIASFTAAPATITAGGSSTLAWSTTGAVSLSLDQGIGTVTGTSRSVNPASTTTYTLTAANAVGSTATATATVTVVPPPDITHFTAAPGIISAGGSSTLAWSATGATGFSLDPGIGTVAGGSRIVTPAATTTYTLTASNAAGTATTATSIVTVVPLPVIAAFSASPATVTTGGSSTLSWTVAAATGLAIDQGVGAVSGTSQSVSPAQTTAYTLTATNAAGTSVTAMATVTVVPPPVISSFTAAPAIVSTGQSSLLSWSVANASSLNLDQGIGTVTGTGRSVNPAATTTYALTAANTAGATTTASATVTVVPSPVITSFTATPAAINTGQSSTLAWTVAYANSLNLDQGIGTVSGLSTIVSPAATTTYTLTATNAAGTAVTAAATVTVTPRTTQVNLHVKIADTVTNATWAAYQDGASGPWVPLTGAAGQYTFTLQDPSGLFAVAVAYAGPPGTQKTTRVVQATIDDLDALALSAPARIDPALAIPVVREVMIPVQILDLDTLNSLPLKSLGGSFSGLINGQEVVDVYAYNRTLGLYRNLSNVGNATWTMNVPPGTYDLALCKVKFLDSSLRSLKLIRDVDLNTGPVTLPPEAVTSWPAALDGQILATLPTGAASFFGRSSYAIDGADHSFTFKIPNQEGALLGYGNANPFTFKTPPGIEFGPNDSGLAHVMAFDGSSLFSTEAIRRFKGPGALPSVVLPPILPAPMEWTDTPIQGTGNSEAAVHFGTENWCTLANPAWYKISTSTPGMTLKETLRSSDYHLKYRQLVPADASWFRQASVPGLPDAFGTPYLIQHTTRLEAAEDGPLLEGLRTALNNTTPPATDRTTVSISHIF